MASELADGMQVTLNKLRAKRERLITRMGDDDQKHKVLDSRASSLFERLNKVQKRMNNRITAKKEYEKTIMETEGAYSKIVDSSQSLMSMLQVYIGADDSDADDIIAGKDVENMSVNEDRLEMVKDDGTLNTAAIGQPEEE